MDIDLTLGENPYLLLAEIFAYDSHDLDRSKKACGDRKVCGRTTQDVILHPIRRLEGVKGYGAYNE